MKKLPEIYKQSINKKISNNNTVYSTIKKDDKQYDELLVTKFIDDLFNEKGHIFNKALTIATNDNTYNTAIVQRKNGYIYTLSGKVIKISDIIEIKKNIK